MGESAIVVHELRKRFGAKQAVAGIDLEIAAGSFAGLVGPKGAGKTLQRAFIDLVGSRAGEGEGLSWLGSSSN
jgi:ABC-type uncharacterized transport system ATPase subunit